MTGKSIAINLNQETVNTRATVSSDAYNTTVVMAFMLGLRLRDKAVQIEDCIKGF